MAWGWGFDRFERVGWQSSHYVVAKTFVVHQIPKQVKPDQRARQTLCLLTGNLAEVGPIQVHPKDIGLDGRQAYKLFLSFFPACRASGFEELRAEGENIFVSGEALFLGVHKNGDGVGVIATSEALVYDNISSFGIVLTVGA